MRKFAACVRSLAGTLVLSALCAGAASAQVSFPEFQSRLSPHGHWLVSARYGNVWQPSVARPGWNPYYDGHWEYTDVGQTWVSDYPWGSIPYHYGTWAVDPGRGWVWVPGDTWAPSWVVFRTGPDFIGWAPVPPGFVVGGAIVAGPELDGPGFVFVPSRQFFAPRIRTCVVPSSRTTIIIKKTKIVQNNIRIENHVVVNRGPSLGELQRATGRPVRTVRLESVKCLGPGVGRREIRVDEARARAGVRAVEPSMTRPPKREGQGRDGRDNDRPEGNRNAYDAVERRATPRVAHQDVHDRDARASRRDGDARDDGVGASRSERDVRLLASRERNDRGRARTGGRKSDKDKTSKAKVRS